MKTLALALAVLALSAADAAAQSSVTVVGSLQSELGCSADWKPDCPITKLTKGAGDGIWRGTWTIPGAVDPYEYKVALDGSWDVNYGDRGVAGGANIPLALPTMATTRFYFDPVSHWLTDDRRSVIATAAGSFQSELGCPGDWQPGCLRSWLQDPDGDGRYVLRTAELPAGAYELKVALRESWEENYGVGGRDGGNVPLTVERDGQTVEVTYDAVTHAITAGPPIVPAPDPDPATPTATPTTEPPPPAPTPPPVTAPADTTAPALAITGKLRPGRWLRRAGQRVTITVGERSRITWRLRDANGTLAGRGAFTVGPGRWTRTLRLSRSARKRLAQRNPRRLTLVLRATDPAGNTSTTRRTTRR